MEVKREEFAKELCPDSDKFGVPPGKSMEPRSKKFREPGGPIQKYGPQIWKTVSATPRTGKQRQSMLLLLLFLSLGPACSPTTLQSPAKPLSVGLLAWPTNIST